METEENVSLFSKDFLFTQWGGDLCPEDSQRLIRLTPSFTIHTPRTVALLWDYARYPLTNQALQSSEMQKIIK